MEDRDDILRVSDLRAGYQPDSPILKGVSLRVGDGQICAIIGPNGAGKSTVLKAIYRLTKWREGTILFGDDDLSNVGTTHLSSLGIGYVPQEHNVFARMSVLENLELASASRPAHRRQTIAAAQARFPILTARARTPAGALSGGERQRLALAMALINNPKLVLLDEPTAGLSPSARMEAFQHIRALGKDGCSVLLVEQNAYEALAIADFAYVLVDGQNFREGPASILLADRSIRKSFLGVL